MSKGEAEGRRQESRKSSQCKGSQVPRLSDCIKPGRPGKKDSPRHRGGGKRAGDALRVLQLLGDLSECNSRTLMTVALPVSTYSYPAWHK